MRNLIGQRFGRLVVINITDKRYFTSVVWLCKCDCGKYKEVPTSSLTRGLTKSCGCLLGIEFNNGRVPGKRIYKTGATKKYGLSFNLLYSRYKDRAKRNNREFNIDKDTFYNITQQNCYYCNDSPRNFIILKSDKYIYNGIDRIDNTKGYIVGNILPCCKICNRAKLDMKFEEFIDWINRIKAIDKLDKM